jgi:hypothetical protein
MKFKLFNKYTPDYISDLSEQDLEEKIYMLQKMLKNTFEMIDLCNQSIFEWSQIKAPVANEVINLNKLDILFYSNLASEIDETILKLKK